VGEVNFCYIASRGPVVAIRTGGRHIFQVVDKWFRAVGPALCNRVVAAEVANVLLGAECASGRLGNRRFVLGIFNETFGVFDVRVDAVSSSHRPKRCVTVFAPANVTVGHDIIR